MIQRYRKSNYNKEFNSLPLKRQNWREVERKSHTVFVDGLPHDIAKASLYKIFGWAGEVVDIYVSRKRRRESNRPFVFVRFGSKGGAERAVQKINERKAIRVKADPTQTDILKRSLVAESLNTIRFGWTKEQIAEKWEGPCEVDCRDLGPFRCILKFETAEARDIALESPGLQSLFFEMRPQWGFTW
ncbi:hypothetical protein PIB30_094023, partial [Stylosanthes scabra]|nr:hypothetical protein [Stylosanthes scabra]